jgi:peptidyl-prolyl cis-trans isomerase B (cyclophilin B)
LKRLASLALVLVLVLTACGHKQSSQAQAEAARAPVSTAPADSMPQPPVPVYPRAQLVALPEAVVPAPAIPAEGGETNAAPRITTTVISNTLETPGSPAVETTTGNASTNSVSSDSNLMTNPGATAIPQTDTPPTAAPAPPENIQVVVLQTTLGKMVLQLDDFAAPKTCANFRNLVSTGFYNGTIFHRVIPHFVIQGGDPNSKTDNRASYGQGDPGYTLPAEIKLSHDRGAVAMARLPDTVNPRQDSNGSQFYICVEACPSLDDQYTVFAHVIRGMDVAERIAAVPRDNRDDPLVRIVMDARLEPKDQAMQESPAVNR